jgi:hypothetical protein
VTLLLGAGAVGMAPGGASPPGTAPEPDAAPVRGADLELLGEIRRIAEHVETLREASFPRLPIAVRASAKARRAAAEVRLASVLPPERLEARGRAWSDLGLGDPGVPARVFGRLADDLDGIVLDRRGRRLLVDPGRLSEADFHLEGDEGPAGTLLLATGIRPDEPLVAHQLVHLLQDARGGEGSIRETTDATLAAAAWAEGEANLVALRHLFQTMGIESEVLERGLDPGSVLGGGLLPPGLDDLPGAEKLLLEPVYRDGFLQAAKAWRAGGWERFEGEARARATFRDLLHPDREPLEAPAVRVAERPPEGMVEADRDRWENWGSSL